MAMIADLRKELEREAEEENIPILRRAERKLLLEAAAAADPKKILEVGTAIGYSALLLAEYFPLAEIDTIEIDALRNERAVSVMQAAGFEQRVPGSHVIALFHIEMQYPTRHLTGNPIFRRLHLSLNRLIVMPQQKHACHSHGRNDHHERYQRPYHIIILFLEFHTSIYILLSSRFHSHYNPGPNVPIAFCR